MNRKKIRKIVDALVQHIDYDMWKEKFNEDTVEYGEDVESNFDELIDIIEEVLEC